jgi:hypothetical protein
VPTEEETYFAERNRRLLAANINLKARADAAGARVAKLEALIRDVNWLLTHVVFADTFGPDDYERACEIDYRVRAASGEFSPVTKGNHAN